MHSEDTDKYIYIENTHNAPITCTVKDKDTGVVKLTRKFNHAMTEKWSGKQITTGFERLTEEEYKLFCDGSRGFRHYKDDLKLLVVHEELPPEAKAPHEALADARRTARAAEAKIKERDAVITELKAKLLDAETKYRTLESASSDEEKLAPLNEAVERLTTENERLYEVVEATTRQVKELTKNKKLTSAEIEEFGKAIEKLEKELLDQISDAIWYQKQKDFE